MDTVLEPKQRLDWNSVIPTFKLFTHVLLMRNGITSGLTTSVFLLRVRHEEFSVLRIRFTFGLTDEIHCSEFKIIYN